jgi:ATP-dependent helicase/nuclease subunit B
VSNSNQSLSIYTIPAGHSFLDCLAAGLLRKKDLHRMEIFLPTRRGCNELKQALLRRSQQQFLLLPKLSPLGDLDENEELFSSPLDESDLKPLIPPLVRLGFLTKLIEDYTHKSGLPSSPSLSLKLAKSLIRLMDQAAIENVPWERLLHLVPTEFANHWQLTLDFLNIITLHWPQILEEKGFIEPYTRHQKLVDRLIARWEKNPPTHPILAAGSTGTMPATTRLLQAVAGLPQGAVILPALDQSLSPEEGRDLSPCHPQYALFCFLEKAGLSPYEVPLWPDFQNEKNHPRARLFREVLKSSFSHEQSPPSDALEDVSMISCATPQEEALVIALLMRQHLETPHQRICLVTADLKLAERVKEELKRWNIDIDSSSGEPLDQTSPGVFLKLCAEYLAFPEDPVIFLSLLKHPLTYMEKPRGKLRHEIQRLEKQVLRARKSHRNAMGEAYAKTLQSFTTNLNLKNNINQPFEEIFNAHFQMAEVLSTDEAGICQIWEGAKGRGLASFMKRLKEASVDYPSLPVADYPALLAELIKEEDFREPSQKHPRLSILGSLEARLFQADVVILGGLNEGTWPPETDVDPWLNRSMRQTMGFPSPERRVGLSAHDFGQAFVSPKVYLTRALKVNGTPTIESRWLKRLEVYLKTWDLSLPTEPRVLDWVRHLDLPDLQQVQTPSYPTPPIDARPRRLSVTQIETWMRDPYALYARHILSLSPLDPIEQKVDAAIRGTLIHAALDQLFKVCPDPHHPNTLDILLFIGKTLFEPYQNSPSLKLFWEPRFFRLAQWFVETEKQTRIPGTQTFTEVKGKLTLTTQNGPFECIAKADRIDLLPDGRLRIIDYKTGIPPTDQDVMLGFSPQLPLEGAIALHQGFEEIQATRIESLQFWWLRGDQKGGVIKSIAGDPHELSLKALSGLERMILMFENEAVPYPPRPLPTKALRYNDYAHLARLSSL